MKNYKAILFDMDGVLIESEFLMRSSAIQALADYGVEACHEDFYEFTGMGEDRFVGGVAEKHGKPYVTAMKDLAYDYYGQRVKAEAHIPEGVKEMLQKLHSKGIILAVCSAADLRKVRYNIQAIGVDESLFSALVTGSDVERKKPFPTSIWKVPAGSVWIPGIAWWWKMPSAASRLPTPPVWTRWVSPPLSPRSSWLKRPTLSTF